MQEEMVRVDLSQVNGSAFLTVAGEIDAHSVHTLRDVLEKVDVDKRVVIDMADVSFMDSSGLHALVAHAVRIEGGEGSLRIVNPSGMVLRLVELSGLGHFLDTTESDQRAV